MGVFLNVFVKSIAFFLSILTILLITIILISFFDEGQDNFTFVNGDENSSNIIAIIELNGIIIEK